MRLFDAEAASIALFEPDPDRLEFRVAAGAQGAGAVGLSVPPTQGIAGFVFSTGQALALSDVAERSALQPGRGRADRLRAALDRRRRRSSTTWGAIGVLQVLDKRSSPTFSLRDMELLGVFAGQATVAIAAARVQRDTDRACSREVLGQIEPALTDDQVDERRLARRPSSLDDDDEAPFWRSSTRSRGCAALSDRELSLVADILEVVADHAAAARRGAAVGR